MVEVRHKLASESSGIRTWTFVGTTYIFSWSCWYLARLLGGQNLLIPLPWNQSNVSVQYTWIVEWIGNMGPSFGLLVVLVFLSNSHQKREILYDIRKFRTPLGFYVFALIVPFATFYIADLVRELLGAHVFFIGTPTLWTKDILLNVAVVPLWEEIGWRGFLLPKLQQQHSNFTAAIWVGVVWGVWHVPSRIRTIPQGSHPNMFVTLFIIYIVGLSLILAWLYNATGRSIWPGIMFHSAINTAASFFISPELDRYGGLSPLLGAAASIWALVGVILFLDSRRKERIFFALLLHQAKGGWHSL